MQIVVKGRHVQVADEVRRYVEEKAGRLGKFYDRVQEIEAILDRSAEQFTVELIVRAGNKHTFVASETGPDAFALIDLVTEKIERQLLKLKEKNRNHKHDGKPSPKVEPGG